MTSPLRHSKATIRTGKRSDIPGALALVHELAAFEKQPHAVVVSESEMEKCGFGPNKLFDFFVAEAQDKIVGFALYFEYYSTWNGRCVYLEDLYVQSAYRSMGIGSDLFHAVVSVAHERGVRRMKWQVLDWNKPAIQFYKKVNAEIDNTWMNCQLNQTQLQQLVSGTAKATNEVVSDTAA